MIRFIVYITIGFLFLFVESTWLAAWPSKSIRLELVWILVLFLGFSMTLRESGFIVISLGLMEDLIGTPFMGLYAAIYFMFVALIRSFSAHMFMETLWARLLWVGILTVFAMIMEWMLMAVLGQSEGIGSFVLAFGLLQGLMNMLLAAIMLPLLDRCEGFIFAHTRLTHRA